MLETSGLGRMGVDSRLPVAGMSSAAGLDLGRLIWLRATADGDEMQVCGLLVAARSRRHERNLAAKGAAVGDGGDNLIPPALTKLERGTPS